MNPQSIPVAIPVQEWFTPEEAGRVLRKSASTIKRWISSGQIEAFFIRQQKQRRLMLRGYVIHRTEVERVKLFGPSRIRPEPELSFSKEEFNHQLNQVFRLGQQARATGGFCDTPPQI